MYSGAGAPVSGHVLLYAADLQLAPVRQFRLDGHRLWWRFLSRQGSGNGMTDQGRESHLMLAAHFNASQPNHRTLRPGPRRSSGPLATARRRPACTSDADGGGIQAQRRQPFQGWNVLLKFKGPRPGDQRRCNHGPHHRFRPEPNGQVKATLLAGHRPGAHPQLFTACACAC